MSSEVFGKMSLIVGADATQFDQVMDRTSNRLKTFGKESRNDFASTVGGYIKDPASLLGFAGDKVTTVLQGFSGPIGIAVAGLSSMVYAMDKLADGAVHVGEKWHELTIRAQKFDISAEQMAGLDIASKGHPEELEKGMQKYGKLLGEAINGGKEARADLKAMGLDWQKLSRLDAYDQMKAAADAIKSMPLNVQRTAAEMKLFGKSGTELHRLVMGGSTGIDAASKKAYNKGITPDEGFMKDYEDYLAAKKDWDRTSEGFWNRLQVYVGKPFMKIKAEAMRGGADVLDSWFGRDSQFQYGLYVPDTDKQAAAKRAAADRKEDEKYRKQAERARALEQFQKTSSNIAIVEDLKDMRLGYETMLPTIGMSSELAKAHAMAVRGGTTGIREAAAEYGKLANVLREIDAKKYALKLEESTATPIEKLRLEYTQLQEAFARGDITENLFGRGLGKIADEAEKLAGKEDFPKAFAKGSQEDRTIGLKMERDAHQQDPVEKLNKAMGKLQVEAQRQTGVQRQLLEAYKSGAAQFNVLSF